MSNEVKGYKVLRPDYTCEESCINRWRNLTDDQKKTIVSLPNFDAEIFKKITGIDVSE